MRRNGKERVLRVEIRGERMAKLEGEWKQEEGEAVMVVKVNGGKPVVEYLTESLTENLIEDQAEDLIEAVHQKSNWWEVVEVEGGF